MKTTLNWLKQYVDFDWSPDELTERLTMLGLEVEHVQKLGGEFDGIVVAQNEALIRKPELLNQDAFGAAWMLVVRPADEGWRNGLITGSAVAEAFEQWLADAAYKDRSE